MTKTLATLSILIGLTAYANSADVSDLAKKAQVTNRCAQQILAAATHQCDAESGNVCNYQSHATGKMDAHFLIGFSTKGSAIYSYSVVIIEGDDPDNCGFRIRRAN